MKNLTKYLSATALLVCAVVQADENCGVSPTFVARSQARYKVREDVGVVDQTNLYDMESWYGTFAIIPGYMQSFRPSSIARTLFGNGIVNNNNLTGSVSSVVNSCNTNCNTGCDNGCGSTILIQGSQCSNSHSWCLVS